MADIRFSFGNFVYFNCVADDQTISEGRSQNVSKSGNSVPKPLQLSFLGAPQVSYQGTILKFRSRKVLALLIYLVIEGGQHHREKLVDIFWSASGQSQGNATLRSTLARLKKTLAVAGEFLITESGTIGFDNTQKPLSLMLNR